MSKLYAKSQSLLHAIVDECGQDSVEYAILIGIIAVTVIANVTTISSYVSSQFSTLAGTL
jgi:Flp pilus assembly pilin Flp